MSCPSRENGLAGASRPNPSRTEQETAIGSPLQPASDVDRGDDGRVNGDSFESGSGGSRHRLVRLGDRMWRLQVQ
jgi:hypothetical protein